MTVHQQDAQGQLAALAVRALDSTGKKKHTKGTRPRQKVSAAVHASHRGPSSSPRALIFVFHAQPQFHANRTKSTSHAPGGLSRRDGGFSSFAIFTSSEFRRACMTKHAGRRFFFTSCRLHRLPAGGVRTNGSDENVGPCSLGFFARLRQAGRTVTSLSLPGPERGRERGI